VTINASSAAPAFPVGEALEWRIYTDLRQVAAVSRQWEELLADSKCNRAFSSREWYAASCLKQNSWTPLVVAAFHSEKILGLLPLVVDHEDETVKFPHHAADYNDVIVRIADPLMVVGLLSQALANAQGCRRMVLSKLRADSHCVHALPLLRTRPQFQCEWREIDTYRFIELPESFDDYLGSRSKALRKNIRRTLRDLDRNGLVMRELRPETFAASDIPELLLALAMARHGNRCSFTRTAYVQEFLLNVLPRLFQARYLRAFALCQGERIVGLDLCLVSARGMATWNGGFLPEIERYSPGSALFAFAIQQAIASGLREFDFVRGEEAYKCSWTNGSYAVGELELRM
jgi:CelD/BcsL family acetyltransferase involved in cellulose biosynthesis